MLSRILERTDRQENNFWYCEKTNELVSDAIGVAYPIMNGIPCLIPTQGRILDNSKEEQSSTKLSSSNK
ncbi:uncharacterized protein [Physcomitrium patens]|uniref:uncharacterized protein isoform X3 n=1 Tax=Physcomitrium patens TaxID=3218 RepID=UPI003CCCD2DD